MVLACKPVPPPTPAPGATVAAPDGIAPSSPEGEPPVATPATEESEKVGESEDEEFGIGGAERTPGRQVRQGKMTVSGGLTKDIVHRISRAHISEVVSCYDASLKSEPDLGGRMAVTFQVRADGKVEKAELSGPAAAEEDLTACVAKAVRAWKLPNPERGAAKVEFFYEFQPR